MLGYIRRFIMDRFLGKEATEARGTKRVPHIDNASYLENVNLDDTELIKRSVSPYNQYGEHDESLPTLLIVDDCDINSLYGADFQLIKTMFKADIYKMYNVYQATGPLCGKLAMKLIKTKKVDRAILDLTLGNFFKLDTDGDRYIEVDGVDIGLFLYKTYPDVKLLFSTAHIFNERYPEFGEYIEKFEKTYPGSFIDFYINKLVEDRSEKFYKFLEV